LITIEAEERHDMKVFISHGTTDNHLAKQVADSLREAGFDAWLDVEQVFLGDNWPAQVGQALEKSEAMVVLLTPDSVRSEQISRDVAYDLGSLNYEYRLVPVLVGEPDVLPEEEIPWVLRRLSPVRVPKVNGSHASLTEIARALRSIPQPA
jgi:hypothetical protein